MGCFFKYAELIKENRPRWVLIENVPGLLNAAGGKDFGIVTRMLDELGYCVSWRVLDAKFFGTPQRRRRTYIVASAGTVGAAAVLFEPGGDQVIDLQSGKSRNFVAKEIDASLPESNYFSIQHAGINRKPTADPQGKGYRNDGEMYTLDFRSGADAVCKTDDTFGIREASGISGWMDGNRYKAIGNAVAIPVIRWLAERIAKFDSVFYH